MRRLHLLEFEDQAWCPRSLRDAITSYLQFSIETMRMYHALAPRLRAALARMGTRRVVDLCSGAGGPWRVLLPELENGASAPLEVTLTDYYPNLPALERMRARTGGRVGFERESVNAARVPERLQGFRTLFTSFHHFRPQEAREILRDAVRGRQGIAISEFTHRSVPALAAMVMTPVVTWLSAPFVRPLRATALLWAYVLPVLPLIAMIDGFVSCLRTYTTRELREMVNELGEVDYTWEIGEERIQRAPFFRATYLIGTPNEAAAGA